MHFGSSTTALGGTHVVAPVSSITTWRFGHLGDSFETWLKDRVQIVLNFSSDSLCALVSRSVDGKLPAKTFLLSNNMSLNELHTRWNTLKWILQGIEVEQLPDESAQLGVTPQRALIVIWFAIVPQNVSASNSRHRSTS